MSELRYAKISGWGKYVPEKVLTNADLEKMVDTSDEWITARTGIKERHIRTEKDTNSSMSVAAARDALKVAGLEPKDLDLIILATSSPDYYLPSGASLVQHQLGADCGAFQLGAGCSGWVYGLIAGTQFVRTGLYNNVLVIGVDIVSYAVDYTDRTTCVLFGDAAAAVVLTPSDKPAGVLTSELGSDGAEAESLYVPGGASSKPFSQEMLDNREQYIRMDGQRVFKFASRVVAQSMKRTIAEAGLLPDDIDLFIPHQANARIIQAGAKLMRQPIEKFYMNLDKYGNTSAASVPLALVEAIEEGRLKDGDKVAMVAFGAGLSWAAAVVQMGVAQETESAADAFFRIGRAQYMAKRVQNAVMDGVQSVVLPLYTWRRGRKKKNSR